MSTHEAHRRSPSPTKGQQRTSRPASPVKGPLHRMLQSITPSPSGSFGGGPKLYETLDQPQSSASRSNSLHNDHAAYGDHLPSDTFSPEPSRPRSRAESTTAGEEHHVAASPLQRNGTVNVYHSDLSSDTHRPGSSSAAISPSGSRGRTLSYTSGDTYAPWGAPPPQQQQYAPQPSPYTPQQHDHPFANHHHQPPHHPHHSQPGPPLPLPAPPSQPLHRGHSLQEASQHRSYSPRPFEGQPPRTSSDTPTAYAGSQDLDYIPPAPHPAWQADQTMPRHDSYGPQRRYTYGGPPQGWQSEHHPHTLQQSYYHPPPPPFAGPSSWQTPPPQHPPPRSPSPLPPPPISPRSCVSQAPDPQGPLAYPSSATATMAPPAPWGPMPSAVSPQSPVSRGSGTVRRSLPQPPGTPPGVARPPSIPSYIPGQTPPTTPTRAAAYVKGSRLVTPLSPALATPPAALPSTIATVDQAEPNDPVSATAEAAILQKAPSSASGPIGTASPAPQASSPISGSALNRSDSILSAAEELMARGMPSRRGRGAPGRFGRSPLSVTSAPPTASESTGRQREQPLAEDLQDRSSGGLIERAETTTMSNEDGELSEALKGISLKASDAASDHEATSAAFNPTASVFDGPTSPPRPSSRGPRDAIVNDSEPKYSAEPDSRSSPPVLQSQRRRAPAFFAEAQQEVAARHHRSTETSTHITGERAQHAQPSQEPPLHGLTRVESIRSAAAAIPKIYSPPPNAAPPVPSIALPDEGDVASVGGPVIAITAPEDNSGMDAGAHMNGNSASTMPSFSFSGPDEEVASGPTINVLGAEDNDADGNTPMISLSGPDGYDSASPSSGAGMTPSISLSHTSGFTPAMPQRASATSSTSLAEQAARAQSEAQYRNGGVPQAPFDHRQSASSVAGTTCGACSKYIAGRVVQAINQSFHPACFACNHCKELLEHVAFYEHDGKAYCHFDYHELFSLRCFHCRTPIVDERFIQINDPELLSSSNAAASQKGGKNGTVGGAASGTGVRYYHDLHFFCANCGDPFIDPKVASSTSGSERGKIQVDEDGRVLSGGKAFVVWKGYPYCESCHHSVHKPSCKACRKPILYDVITALKGKWHPECFVCEGCKRPFEDERVFVDSQGRGYDEECYRIWLKGTL